MDALEQAIAERDKLKEKYLYLMSNRQENKAWRNGMRMTLDKYYEAIQNVNKLVLVERENKR